MAEDSRAASATCLWARGKQATVQLTPEEISEEPQDSQCQVPAGPRTCDFHTFR